MEKLFKASLTISITGILMLLFLANILEPKAISIININEKMLNNKVKIRGTITTIKDQESFKVLLISDETGDIDILCRCQEIENNQFVEITGKVQEYKRNLQINADKIINLPRASSGASLGKID